MRLPSRAPDSREAERPPTIGGGGNDSVTPDDVSEMSMEQYKKAREEGAIK